jgi:magnesium transporter
VTEVVTGLEAAERARVAALRADGRFFWLDVSLGEASRDDVIDALGVSDGALGPLPGSADASASRTVRADGASVAFTLRCYAESEGRAGAAGYRLRALEVRVVVTSGYLVTVHRERVSLPAVLALDLREERTTTQVVYTVLHAMLETGFLALDEVDRTLEGLAEAWDEGGAGVPRPVLRASGARLAAMRRWATAQQAVVERAVMEIGALPGFEPADDPHFHRLDQLVDRLPPSIDAAADAMGMLLDLQLNERAYLLSVVATIFVPLTFVTGFFGMNFGWMIDHIDTQIAFWGLGMAIPVATAALSWRFLLRRLFVGDEPKAQGR